MPMTESPKRARRQAYRAPWTTSQSGVSAKIYLALPALSFEIVLLIFEFVSFLRKKCCNSSDRKIEFRFSLSFAFCDDEEKGLLWRKVTVWIRFHYTARECNIIVVELLVDDHLEREISSKFLKMKMSISTCTTTTTTVTRFVSTDEE